MVTIPTSRDVSYVGTRSGRIAPSGPSVSVGAAVADAGQALTHVAYNLNDLRTQEQIDNQNKAGFDLETKIAQFRDQEEQSFNKAREGTTESGIGFTRSFMEGYEKRANDFVKANFADISEAQNAQSRQTLLGLGNSLYGKAHAYEQQSKTNFYDRTTNGNLDKVRTQIGGNAAPFEQLKKQGLDAINSADMPEAWKAERRAQWDADAAESKWRWKFAQDPDTAVRQMKGITVDAKGLSNAIKQTAEQLGVNPVDLATIMSYETGGTFDPWKKGPTTKWGTHRGLIQWGEPQRAKYGVTADMPIEQQVAAVGRYLTDAGVQPGMGLIDIYSAVNAGAPGLYDRSDYKQGGAPGTVADKVKYQMEGHKAKAAALLGGKYQPQAGDPDLDAIPYDRRQQLANWGETEYSQQITKQRAAAKDGYSLLIATQPEQVNESVILQDPAIDTGDKAQLITSLRSALKEGAGVNQFIGAVAQGNVDVNPFNADQVKVADKGYEKLLSVATTAEEQKAVTSDFVARTGYIPKKVQAELRSGAASTDPAAVAQSMEAGLVLSKNAPVSFGAFEGSAGVRNKMDLYRAYTRDMGYSPDEAARKLIDANDPEKAAQREALLKSKTVADELKNVSSSSIAATFDDSFLGRAINPSLGPTPQAEAVMVAEYRSIYQEAIVESGGDLTAAKKAANERFQRTYGVTGFSTMGNNVVVKNPPEKTYPAAPDGTFDYIREQLAEAMQEQGIKSENYYLQPDAMTEIDVRAGRPPRYAVFYEEDGKIERFNLPFVADPAVMQRQFKEKKANALRQSEGRMIDNRARGIRESEAVSDAVESTVGPDWMKARAGEMARERVRQDETLREFNPGPINGGGGGGY